MYKNATAYAPQIAAYKTLLENYLNLLKKIKQSPADRVADERIRVNDGQKMVLLFSSAVRNRLNLL